MRSRPPFGPILTILLAAAAAAGCASADPEAAQEHERRAAQLLQAGRVEEGVAELEAALEEDPGSINAATTLAAAHERGGDPARAIETLRRCLEARPGAQLPRMRLGAIYARLGELEKALEQFAAAGAGSKPHAPAFLSMAEIHEIRGERAAAERAIIRAIETEPAGPEAHYRLARLYDGLGRPEARDAWSRYVAVAVGIAEERARLEEAHARLLVLGPQLTPPEKRALFGALRRHLETIPVHRGPLAPSEAQPVAGDVGPPQLRRPYPGRVFVKLHVPALGGGPPPDPVRGVGSGATLYGAVVAAADDVARSRVFDLYYATQLHRARIEAHLEVGAPRPLAAHEGGVRGETSLSPPDDRDGDLVAKDGPIGPDEALEMKLAQRSVVILPTDRAARGLRTLRQAIEAAARDAGLPPGDWRRAAIHRFATRGFVEAADGGAGAPADLDGGVPAAPAPTRAAALEAIRRGADWIAAHLGADGAIPSVFDPASGRLATATARAQAYAVVALADAARTLGDERLGHAARVAHGWLAALPAEPGSIAPAARAALRLEESAPSKRSLALLEEVARSFWPAGAPPMEEKALVFAEAAARPAWKAAIEKWEHRGGPRAGSAPGALDAALRAASIPGAPPLGSAAYLAAHVLGRDDPRLKPREGDGAGAIQANIALGALRSNAADGTRLIEDAVRAALRLSIDERAIYLYPDRARALGAFRDDRFGPRISLEETARLVSALSVALPYLR